jgi:hypothetical protein
VRAEGGCWPTYDQELLLHAALLSDRAAVAAWEAWQRDVPELERLDWGSVRLLPLLYLNMKRIGVSHPRIDVLKGVSRKAWYQNRLLSADLAEALRALAARGVAAIVVKGGALARTVYPELAARPMGDVDLLVRVPDVRLAIEVLRWRGMRPTHPLTERRIPLIHSLGFVAPTGRQVDLHWHAVEEDCRPGADDEFWRRAVPLDVDGVPALALEATDQLFQVCVHGVRWEPTPPIRWVADAVLLARTGAVRWSRLPEQAADHRLVLQLHAALAYLRRLFPAEVPPRVVDDLAALPVAAWQRREHAVKTRPDSYWRRLRFHYYNHRRQRAVDGGLGEVLTFPAYLLARWGLSSAAEAPRFVTAELRRRRDARRRASMAR